MRVFSTLMSWSNENKICMRVDARDFAWEFHKSDDKRKCDQPGNKDEKTSKT